MNQPEALPRFRPPKRTPLRWWFTQAVGRCALCDARRIAYCDHVDEFGNSCSKPICQTHAKAKAGKFLCPEHAPQ